MFFLSPFLKCLIDPDTGEVPVHRKGELGKCVDEAVSTAMRMIGCTLQIRKRRYVITSLELYYGGAGDLPHDWHRSNFPKSKTGEKRQSIIRNKVQAEEGLRIYLNQKGGSHYKRMDLVIGPQGVPISLLLRNVFDLDRGILVGTKNGQPNVVLRYMGLRDEDHGRKFGDEEDFQFLDTHAAFYPSIVGRRRFTKGKYEGFRDDRFGRSEWNFTMVNLEPPLSLR